jgi:hypothetical protein
MKWKLQTKQREWQRRILYQFRHCEDAYSGTALRKLLIRQVILTRSAYLPAAVPEHKARLEAVPELRIDDVSEGNLENALRTVALFRGAEPRRLPPAAKQFKDLGLHRMGKVVPPLLATLI